MVEQDEQRRGAAAESVEPAQAEVARRGAADGAADGDSGAAPAGQPPPDREAEQAHGGSMAPGLVDDTGEPEADLPPRESGN